MPLFRSSPKDQTSIDFFGQLCLKNHSKFTQNNLPKPNAWQFEPNFNFEELEIAGWGGNSGIWAASNGSNSRIEVSIDKVDWNNVGTIPSTYSSSIIPVKLTKSVSARFIKFVGTSSLGIGFLKIKTD